MNLKLSVTVFSIHMWLQFSIDQEENSNFKVVVDNCYLHSFREKGYLFGQEMFGLSYAAYWSIDTLSLLGGG